MRCPYCGGEMIEGDVLGDRYQLRFQPKDKKLVLGLWASGSTPLGRDSFLGRPRLEAFICQTCNKLVADV